MGLENFDRGKILKGKKIFVKGTRNRDAKKSSERERGEAKAGNTKKIVGKHKEKLNTKKKERHFREAWVI